MAETKNIFRTASRTSHGALRVHWGQAKRASTRGHARDIPPAAFGTACCLFEFADEEAVSTNVARAFVITNKVFISDITPMSAAMLVEHCGIRTPFTPRSLSTCWTTSFVAAFVDSTVVSAATRILQQRLQMSKNLLVPKKRKPSGLRPNRNEPQQNKTATRSSDRFYPRRLFLLPLDATSANVSWLSKVSSSWKKKSWVSSRFKGRSDRTWLEGQCLTKIENIAQ